MIKKAVLVPIISCSLAFSCQNSSSNMGNSYLQNNPDSLNNTDSVAVSPDTIFLYMSTNYAGVKIRQTPDLQGVTTEIIQQIGSILTFQNDSTNFETETKLNNQPVKARWYKVQNPQTEKEGWVFGQMASFVPKDENQHLNYQRKLRNSSGGKEGNSAKIRDTKVDNNLLNTYKNYLRSLNYKQYSHVSQAAIFFENNFANASGATCDRALLDFNGFYQEAVSFAKSKQNSGKYQHLAQEIRSYGRAYAGADSSLFYLSENGIKLVYKEGKVEFGEDWDFVARRFYRFVSPQMRTYLNQIQLESETYWKENGRFVAPLNQIADWAVFWANFNEQNPNFLTISDCQQRSQYWIKLLIYGLDNEAVFDSNKKLNSQYKMAYDYIIAEIRTGKIWGVFAQRFSDFYSALEKSNFSFNNSILKAQQVILNETD